MKINEKILRHLSGLMGEEEKTIFEKELSESHQLLAEYNKIKLYLDNISSVKEISGDPAYFVNLLPRVREKIQAKKKNQFSKKIVYAIPALSAALIIFLIYSPANKNVTVDDLVNEIIANADQREISDRYVNLSNDIDDYGFYEESVPDTVMIPAEWQKGAEAYYITNRQFRNGDDFSLLENLSEKELEEVYKDLSKINI